MSPCVITQIGGTDSREAVLRLSVHVVTHFGFVDIRAQFINYLNRYLACMANCII